MPIRGSSIRWCLRCKELDADKRPRKAMPGSDLCEACLELVRMEEWQAAEEAAVEAKQAAVEAEAQRQEAAATLDTGMGVCTSCGARNIVERTDNEGKDAAKTATCVGCLIFPPALLLLPFLKRNVRYRTCQICGHEWRV